MKNYYIFLLMLVISQFSTTSVSAQCETISADNISDMGPYRVATIAPENGLSDGTFYRNATIYYPEGTTGSLATIAIVPGFLEGAWTMQDWGPFYASHGIVAVIFDTYTSLETPTFRALALNEVLESMKLENERIASPIFKALDLNKLAVSGHSMGGGGAEIAANFNPEIKAVVALNPWHPTPGWYQNNSAVLIIAGGWDTIAPSDEHAFIHYSVTSERMDKALVEFTFGTHFVGNSPKFNGGDVGKLALSWVKLFLEDDDCYCPVLKGDLLKPSFLQFVAETNIKCNGIRYKEDPDTFAENEIEIYPNPVRDIFFVEGFKNGDYSLIDQNGQVVDSGTLTKENNSVNANYLRTGTYYLHIDNRISLVVVQ